MVVLLLGLVELPIIEPRQEARGGVDGVEDDVDADVDDVEVGVERGNMFTSLVYSIYNPKNSNILTYIKAVIN